MSTFGEKLREHNLRNSVSNVRNGLRVVAYTAEGVQCGLPGLGESEENRLTFPQHWTSQQALNSGEWVRFATEVEKVGEAEECKKWWRPLGWTPKSILHSGRGGIAAPDEPMGMYGATVTVLPQAPVHNRVETTREASPSVNLNEIPTPNTPRSGGSGLPALPFRTSA